jgi:putative ABC transport system ATP-binding protein
MSNTNQLLIIGQSGSGKTSLLNAIGGLQKPSAGKVWINETDIYQLSSKKLDFFRGRNIGFVFQQPHFITSLDVESNLKFAQYFVGKKDVMVIHKLLDQVGLLHRKKSRIHELSEGEKQRISIIRAVINSPSIILADEPTSALDDNSCEKILELINSIAVENNAKLIIVTHDQRLKDKYSQKLNLDDFKV